LVLEEPFFLPPPRMVFIRSMGLVGVNSVSLLI
jgi:hypothetical protein